MRRLLLIAALLASPPTRAMDIDWALIGDAGNPGDPTVLDDGSSGHGSVPYDYLIGKYEVTNAQYAEFLNAVAADDSHLLYSPAMTTDPPCCPDTSGGIVRSGIAGHYSYAVKAGFEGKPVNWVGFYDAVRFANWLHNGMPSGAQGPGTTEDGAYLLTLDGVDSDGDRADEDFVSRHSGARFFVPSHDEWYKAAYYDAASAAYHEYPTGTSFEPGCDLPSNDSGNTANCGEVVWQLPPHVGVTDGGAYSQSRSPYGTYDQAGNVREWTDTPTGLSTLGTGRIALGGSWGDAGSASASARFPGGALSAQHFTYLGFRIAAAVPEPDLVRLAPETALKAPGGSHTVSARVTDASGSPTAGAEVSVEVVEGPNTGAAGVCSFDPECRTDDDGYLFFTYPSAGASGVDEIVATSNGVQSNPVLAFWDADCNENEIPDSCDLACEGFDGRCQAFPDCGQSLDANGDEVPDDCDAPPDCTIADAEPNELWPPDHALGAVSVQGVTDQDGDAITIRVTAIAQDEPIVDSGSGSFGPDGAGVGSGVALLRAERGASGDGRVYHVAFVADDGRGGTCGGTVRVCVAHDMRPGHGCIDQGALYDSTQLASGARKGACGLGFELMALVPLLALRASISTRRRSAPRNC